MKVNLADWVLKAINEGFPKDLLISRIKEALGIEEPFPEVIETKDHEIIQKLSSALMVPYGYMFLDPNKIQRLYIPKVLIVCNDTAYDLLALNIEISPLSGAVSVVIKQQGQDIDLSPCLYDLEIWIQHRPWLEPERDETATKRFREYLDRIFENSKFEIN